jgi:hypothetical protein
VRPTEADLIAELIARDLPSDDPTISEDVVSHLNRFAHEVGLLSSSVPYDRVVATRVRHLWNPSDVQGPQQRRIRRDPSCDDTPPLLHHAQLSRPHEASRG